MGFDWLPITVKVSSTLSCGRFQYCYLSKILFKSKAIDGLYQRNAPFSSGETNLQVIFKTL